LIENSAEARNVMKTNPPNGFREVRDLFVNNGILLLVTSFIRLSSA